MEIVKIKVKNFRLLKDFEVSLEKILSLVVGKNNSGKTSLVSVLDKFINEKAKDFSCDDFNLDFQKHLRDLVDDTTKTVSYPLGISLTLFIRYEETDNLANVTNILRSLDDENRYVVLYYEYGLSEMNMAALRHAYNDYYTEAVTRIESRYTIEETDNDDIRDFKTNQKKYALSQVFYEFFKKHQKDFFKLSRRSVDYDVSNDREDLERYTDLDAENIKLDNVLNLKTISAKREVSNRDTDRTLSSLSSKYYEKKESNPNDADAIKKFKETLNATDQHLDTVYEGLFKNLVEKVGLFGGLKEGDSVIKIVSTLQHKELLKGNTTVMYDHSEEHSLPEHYNGLGYMNLIGMIFEIEVLLSDFRREHRQNELPADINLLLIEEPEAHTHPQMQYVFIKNIKQILKKASDGEDGQAFSLQTLITTHSSHIAAEGKFDDIKYFVRKGSHNEVIAKSLKDLRREYKNDDAAFKFLKQYLTLNRAELFFADKAILIEGDTERILLPAMMKKVDIEHQENPLLSQNISIIEVGAYSHIFERLIDFLNVRSLIISDIDSAKKKTRTKCRVEDADAELSTNASLSFFHGGRNGLSLFTSMLLNRKTLRKCHKSAGKRWYSSPRGIVLFVFQTKEKNDTGLEYHARSFEDAFFHLNRQFIKDNKDTFKSLKNQEYFEDNNKDAYELAENCVGSKPSFAMEILLNSITDEDGIEYSNWTIPNYIKEGLLWLKNSN